MTVLFTFNIELINILIILISLSNIFVTTACHFSYVLSQILVSIKAALGCTIAQLFLAISVNKLLLVTHFSWIFCWDPSQLGRIIISIAMIVAFLPCTAACIYQTTQNHIMGNMAAYLSGRTFQTTQGINVLTAYLMLWALLAFCMLIFTLLYIPHYLEKQRLSQAIQAGEANVIKKGVNLKRILIGSLGIMFHLVLAGVGHATGFYNNLPITALSSTTSLNLMLVYFILDDKVLKFMKRKLRKKYPVLRIMKISPQPT